MLNQKLYHTALKSILSLSTSFGILKHKVNCSIFSYIAVFFQVLVGVKFSDMGQIMMFSVQKLILELTLVECARKGDKIATSSN